MNVISGSGEAGLFFGEQARAGRSLGFVPTMGALHEGHLSLIRRAKEENETTAVSIFVNPTQFNHSGDFEHYPRDVNRDKALLETEGVDVLFLPDEKTLYPDNYRYRVVEKPESGEREGRFRKGHFEGVLTVVLKLLNLVQADRAYFGEKDWQQYSLIKGMAQALFLKTEILGCPTVREKDGLAMSSRNALLGTEERKLAPKLYEVLRQNTNMEKKREELEASGFRVDYVEKSNGRILAAVHIGNVRLIDNVPF